MPSEVLRRCLPFSAVKGMEEVKKALECVAVDDDLLGILIKGPTGTAKSVLVRSFVSILPDRGIVNVPQNVTDEQLFGGLDIEDAIKFGRTMIKDGILQRADGNILYLDNINLFDARVLGSILDCVESQKVVVERDGISAEYELRTTVIATMDPAEQPLPDCIADRFDICVQSFSADNRDERMEIITANLEYEADPEGFSERYSKEDSEIVKSILGARNILKDVEIKRDDLKKISKVCIDLEVKGHRADISMAKVSKIIAALGGRTEVSDDDIKESAVLCLLHRRGGYVRERNKVKTQECEIQKEDPEQPAEEAPADTEAPRSDKEEVLPEIIETEEEGEKKERIEYEYHESELFKIKEELGTVAEITNAVKEKLEDMDHIEAIRLHKIANRGGRRKDIVTKKLTGRYRRSKIPEGKSVDPAFDATVRAAAPYQRSRGSKGLSINIETQDIREKIRIKNDSCSFLFAVDVSGSLIKSGMMPEILTGVKAMLMDSYVQRDKAALLTFRTGEIIIPVPFTRSVTDICSVLENTMTGDGTPLSAALLMIKEYMLNYIRKNSEERCFVILVTDGDATDAIQRSKDPMWELGLVAMDMKIPNTEWIVIDSSLGTSEINYALDLAKLLNGRYIRLEDLQYV